MVKTGFVFIDVLQTGSDTLPVAKTGYSKSIMTLMFSNAGFENINVMGMADFPLLYILGEK